MTLLWHSGPCALLPNTFYDLGPKGKKVRGQIELYHAYINPSCKEYSDVLNIQENENAEDGTQFYLKNLWSIVYKNLSLSM